MKSDAPAEKKKKQIDVLIFSIAENRSSPSPVPSLCPPPTPPPPLRYPGTFLSGGLQAVLPHPDQLHVRGGEAVPARPAGLHRLPVAAARRGRDRDPAVVRRPLAAQRAGAAAGPAHPHRAARQRQGTANAANTAIKENCFWICFSDFFDRVTG